MSKRNWSVRIAALGAVALLTFVALGTGAFFGASHTPNYGYQSEESGYRRTQSEQAYPSQIDRDRAGLPDFAERIASSPDPSDGSEREKRDLAAQESMSVWAFWMMMVAGASAVITAIGTGFLLWQVMLTREAVEDTSKATLAMERQNKLTEAAQRAWVVLRVVLCRVSLADKEGQLYLFEYEVHVENLGHTPAFNILLISRPCVMANIDHYRQVVENRAKTDDIEDASRTILPRETQVIPLRVSLAKADMSVSEASGRERFVPAIALGCAYTLGADEHRQYIVRAFVMHRADPESRDKSTFFDQLPESDFDAVPRGEAIGTKCRTANHPTNDDNRHRTG